MAASPGAGLDPVPSPVAAPVTLRPLGIGEMLDTAIKVYRSRPRQMILAAAVVTFPAIILQTLVQVSAGDPQALTETDPATGLVSPDLDAFAVYLGGVLVSTVILLVANNLALAGTTRMSLAAYLGDSTDWRESLRFALRRWRPLTGVLAVTTLGLLVGFVLCVAPALWIQGIWAVAVPALLVEDLGTVGALGRSRRLVSGRFWAVLGAIIVGSLLASVLQGVLVAPVLALQLTGSSVVVTSILTGVVQLVAGAVTTPFVAALTAVIYIDLRVRKEGFDLELLARGVGASGPPDATPSVAPTAASTSSGGGPVAPPGGWRGPGAAAGPGPLDRG